MAVIRSAANVNDYRVELIEAIGVFRIVGSVELGEPEPLGSTLKSTRSCQVYMKWEFEVVQVPVLRSRMIVAVSGEQPCPFKKLKSW